LITGEEKTLKLTHWSEGKWFDKPGIGFEVMEEDGVAVQKQFTITSRRLIRAIKPILMKAEDEGRDSLSVSILRSGEGLETRYIVKELPFELVPGSGRRGEPGAK